MMTPNYTPKTNHRRLKRRRYFNRQFVLIAVLIVVSASCVGLAGYFYGQHRAKTLDQQFYQQQLKKQRRQAQITTQKTKNLSLANFFQAQLNAIAQKNHYLGTAEIVYHNQVVATWVDGYANFAQQQANTLNTGFEINSLQKGMTGTLLMQQVALGRVALTDQLSRYYPTVPGADQITLRELLNMTSGLSTPHGFTNPQIVTDQQLIKNDIAKTIYNPQMHHKWHYQAINFILIAGIIEKVSHQTYSQLFQKQIIDKLHLKHTAFAYALPENYQRATGYYFKKGTDPATPYLKPALTTAAQQHSELGTGQVYMSIHDLYQVEKSMLNGKLSKLHQQLFVDGSTSHYGGGYYSYPIYKSVNGAGSGFESRVHISPDGQTALVLLANVTSSRTNMDGMSKQLDQLLFPTK
ncbi:serine hydrolase domain-containing protein [Lapidilactobacillus bayanensis]|uniref:serine hydrolase domain-containing protein n=1 Tax=Lapidilactobacillus bayanensis TaxID=2485998 RepID=UPI000F766935|nr:serine hydrolase domain-containing protein [Lapidilactobacillus bayanensis]